MLSVPLSEGVQFEWEPAGEDGIEIVTVFFGDNGERWLTRCWVEDVGSFHLGEEWLDGFPLESSGLLWFRRYTTAWHPASGPRPPLIMRGSLQHRWFIQLWDDGN